MNERRSVRNYQETSISQVDIEKIKTIISETNHLNDNIPMECYLIEDGSKIINTFTSLMSKYTKISAPHYLAFTSESKDDYLENIGYIGEQIVLKMTELGIGTCWVGVSINQNIFNARSSEFSRLSFGW